MKHFYNIEAEQAILGTLLYKNEAFYQCSDLRAEHFHDETHQRLFDAITRAILAGETANPVTLKEGFDAKYLVGLLNHSEIDIRSHIKQLPELYVGRIIQQAATDVLYGELSGTEGMSVFSNALLEAGQSTLSSRIKTAKQVALEIINAMAEEVPVYSTGLPRLDLAMGGGLHEKRMYAIPADSGAGKTLLAATISNNLKAQDVPHLYVDAEMGEQETHQRSMAKDSKVDSRGFYDKQHRGGNFWSDLGHLANNEKECLVYYSDPFITFNRLQQVVYAAVVRNKIKGFILDYFQLVRGCPKGQNPADFMGDVAQWIASICKRHSIWALVTAQLNRDGEVLGSGGLKRACDQVYNLIRPDEFEPYAFLKNEKSRYTKRMSVGDEENPSLKINELGGYFEQC